MEILKWEEFDTWMVRSLGLSDQIMSGLTMSLEGSMHMSLGLSVRISCTFFFVSFCSFFTFEIIRIDSPGSRNSCLQKIKKHSQGEIYKYDHIYMIKTLMEVLEECNHEDDKQERKMR